MSDTETLLQQIASGDDAALAVLLEQHRDYLRRLIDHHMDRELRSRIDPSDVIQEAQLDVSRRIDDFLSRRTSSFKFWLRRTALEQLIDLRRRHVVAAKRSVRREVGLPPESSLLLVKSLIEPAPSSVVHREELVAQTHLAMGQLSELDQEILVLRHVEELTNAEAANVLEIHPDASSKRYGRAILRLRRALDDAGVQADSSG